MLIYIPYYDKTNYGLEGIANLSSLSSLSSPNKNPVQILGKIGEDTGEDEDTGGGDSEVMYP